MNVNAGEAISIETVVAGTFITSVRVGAGSLVVTFIGLDLTFINICAHDSGSYSAIVVVAIVTGTIIASFVVGTERVLVTLICSSGTFINVDAIGPPSTGVATAARTRIATHCIDAVSIGTTLIGV